MEENNLVNWMKCEFGFREKALVIVTFLTFSACQYSNIREIDSYVK